MRPKSPWNHAHTKLKRLYDERIGSAMTQAEFGKRYGIGNQSMVAQYLGGLRPLNYDVAAKFARALHCKIEDFCPEMANSLAYDILPFVGKALRRAAIFLLVLIAPGFVPSDATACISHNASQDDNTQKHLTKSGTYYTFEDKVLRLIASLFHHLNRTFRSRLFSSGQLSLC